MIVFDSHSDILTDVAIKRMDGKKNVIQNYHLKKLQAGNVKGTILAIWIDPPFANNPTQRMLDILGTTCDEIYEMKEYAVIAYNAQNVEEIQKSGKLAIILGMEGLSGLKGNVSLLSLLYRLGIRHAMLTWNEENEFATGVAAPNTDRGVTALGVKALNRMEELGILIDASHGNEKTFWDIYQHTSKPFIASHSNVYSLCPAIRNLKDTQIKAIAKRQGVIGINAWPEFIDEQHPTAEKLIDHIDYIVNLVGVDYVNFGFDFCNYLTPESLSFSECASTATLDLEDASKIPNLLTSLQKRGYKKEDIEKIAYKNIMRVMQAVLQ